MLILVFKACIFEFYIILQQKKSFFLKMKFLSSRLVLPDRQFESPSREEGRDEIWRGLRRDEISFPCALTFLLMIKLHTNLKFW